MSDEYGPWEPASIGELEQVFAGAPFRWWITGGVALELYAGYSWRDHDDADLGISRADVAALYHHLDGFRPYVAASGQLSPWDGRPLADGENNVWVKDSPEGPWRFDIVIGDGNDPTWIYRRDPRIRRPWSEVVLTTPGGVPYLAPEVQLLFKSKGLRDKDHVDAQNGDAVAHLRAGWVAGGGSSRGPPVAPAPRPLVDSRHWRPRRPGLAP